MLEIPGEEAPTDPGVQARQRQQEEEKARLAAQQKKNRLVGVVALLALLGVSAGGAYAWKAQQEAVTYTMEDYFELELEDMAAPPPEVPQTAGAPEQPTASGGPKASTPRKSSVVSDQAVAQASGAGLGGPKRATGGGPEGDATVAAGPSTALPGGASLGGGAIKVEHVGSDILKGDQEIYDMAKRVINASNGQVQNCYNQRLKALPTLQGAWDVSFVIGKDGAVKNVKAAPVNEKDGELETCIVRAVGSWRFQRISRDQPIKKTYRFGASGW